MEIKSFLADLCGLMSVVGFEYRDEEKLTALVAPYFDEHEYDRVGNHIFVRRCGKENAKRLLVDVHYDEIGLLVKNITEDGHLAVCELGGFSPHVLPASEVVVYGKETMPGIVLTTPCVLKAPGAKNSVVPVTDLLVDVGLTREEAMELTPIGTPIGYEPVYTELENEHFCGKGFDDKCLIVPVVAAVASLDMSELDCDIYVSLSAREEVFQHAVSAAAFRIRPDAAIVFDVEFGNLHGTKDPSETEVGGGTTLTYSAILDRELTDFVMETAREAGLACQPVVEATLTGTHADELVFAAGGIPTVLLGVPICYMHTANETLALSDLKATAKLLATVIRERYGRKDG
ncbi:MAG: M20/M25/M40 family metallo-hydrolase [Clostridia bacterium]|nr:M20/M25/M40 family metallo-hydrolase [Clostridia bacterium]